MSESYQLLTIDTINKRAFVTRKPIVYSDKHIQLSHINPGFRLSECEIVDITNWMYESDTELWHQIHSYQSIARSAHHRQ